MEKGLDVLELIAAQKGGLTQSQIATSLDRSIHEIYRMMNCLEKRGYIFRSRPADLYFLSMRPFEIAHQHDPIRGLLEMALPEMRLLADRTELSCNLGVHSAGRILIVAQVESPAPFGFNVRPGALFPMLPNAAGRVLLARQSPDIQRSWMVTAGADALSKPDKRALKQALETISGQGYAEVRDERFGGVSISFPLIGSYGTALAALTVPYISAISFDAKPLATVRAHLNRAAAAISKKLSGAPATG